MLAGALDTLGKRKVIVIEDDVFNRDVLKGILEKDYEVLTAENGAEGLALLKEHARETVLVLLDILMPVMDGYEFLNAKKVDEEIAPIPVIVTTAFDENNAEIRCLDLGATDFVVKPYNEDIVRQRADSIVRLYLTSAMLNILEYDQVTGLYSSEFFRKCALDIFQKYPEKKFDLICGDIENFKLINEREGIDRGDDLLRFIAKVFRQHVNSFQIASRISADTFALLVEHREDYDNKFERYLELAMRQAPISNIVIKFGIYENIDTTLPVSGILDRAILALRSTKRQYGVPFAKYTESMREHMVLEQKILDSMERGLDKSEFEIFLQPKYDINTEYVVGAEALVRWNHPELGFLAPNAFVPYFERNGFITKLDYYVWKNVCKLLKQWKDEGKPIVPISVNVSRSDFNIIDLPKELCGLLERYGIEREYLHFEVTESSYTEDPQRMIDATKELQELGFIIEMDDFGSGYSSLNMLGELSVNALKIDMKFLQQRESLQKNGILGFVISLGKWMGLDTIAEGVEEREQLTLLREMGCDQVQGYYFAKPMPCEDFIQYLQKAKKKELSELKKKDNSKKAEETLPIEKKYTILLVEDNKTNRKRIGDILNPYYNIVEMQNGQDGLAYLKEHKKEISVVLLDLMMPVMDGFEFMNISRKDKEIADIPVIITSSENTASQLRALKLGADGFVAKPCEKEVLLHAISKSIDSMELKRLRAKIEELR